jgi:hypothetical protein
MKTIAIAILTACLASCAGLNLSLTSPWGDVESIDGATTVTPKPVIIPSRK